MIQQSINHVTAWPFITTSFHLSGIIHSGFATHIAYSVHSISQYNWILDSGAIDHIVAHVSLLTNPKPLGSALHLSNENIVPVTHVREVHLTSDIILYHVQYVHPFIVISYISPNLKLNHPFL